MLSVNKDSDFIIDLSGLASQEITSMGTQGRRWLLTTPKVSEPKWLTPDIKKVYDYKVVVLPNGLRLTKLHTKRKKS